MDSDVGNALSVCARPRLLADGPGRWRWGTLAVYNAMRIPLRRDARPVPTGCTSRFEAVGSGACRELGDRLPVFPESPGMRPRWPGRLSHPVKSM